jgi:uncharacterized phiE125 gp8 family phage protein
MSLKCVTPPLVEPATLEEAQRWVRDWDEVYAPDLLDLIKAAREKVEHETGRALIEQDWALSLPRFPNSRIVELGRAPLVEVQSIQYYDKDGVLQTLSPSLYHDITDEEPGSVELWPNEQWPDTQDRRDAVRITFTAGYGSSRTDVPERLRMAIRDLVEHNYRLRGQTIEGTIIQAIPDKVERTLQAFRYNGWIA